MTLLTIIRFLLSFSSSLYVCQSLTEQHKRLSRLRTNYPSFVLNIHIVIFPFIDHNALEMDGSLIDSESYICLRVHKYVY